MIDYFLPKAVEKLSLDILDPGGKVIRTFAGSAAAPKKSDDDDEEPGSAPPPPPTLKAGLNRFTWDMRHPGFTEFPGMIMWSARNRGPVAVPGRYQAQLTVDGVKQIQPFEIRIDPRVRGASAADLERRFSFASQVRDKVSQANDAVLLIRGVKQQLGGLGKRTKNGAILTAARRLDQRLSAVEGRIYQVRNQSRQDPLNFPIMLNNKLAGLLGVAESAEAAPTDQSYTVFRQLSGQLDQELAQLNTLLDRDLGQLNQALSQANLASVERRPLEIKEEKVEEKPKEAPKDR
jgi:hypothetical protein